MIWVVSCDYVVYAVVRCGLMSLISNVLAWLLRVRHLYVVLSDGKDTTFLQTGKRFVGKMEADVENSRKRFWGKFSAGGFALFWEGSIFNYLFGQPV